MFLLGAGKLVVTSGGVGSVLSSGTVRRPRPGSRAGLSVEGL